LTGLLRRGLQAWMKAGRSPHDGPPTLKLDRRQILPPEVRGRLSGQFRRMERAEISVGPWLVAERIDVEKQEDGAQRFVPGGLVPQHVFKHRKVIGDRSGIHGKNGKMHVAEAAG